MVSRHPLAVSWIICGSRGDNGLRDVISFFLSNFYFCLNGAFIWFLSLLFSSSCYLESSNYFPRGASFLPIIQVPWSHWWGGVVITEEQWWRGRGKMMTTPPLTYRLAGCHSGDWFGPWTGHLKKSILHPTHPWVLTCCIICHFTINFSYSHFILPFLTLFHITGWTKHLVRYPFKADVCVFTTSWSNVLRSNIVRC